MKEQVPKNIEVLRQRAKEVKAVKMAAQKMHRNSLAENITS
ncbi:hypothetical protein GA0116948_104111 [Chitinophaga costaii]|uniref:Uncharacterized protein n=1 Tax=Chitinophaga costaii TaxID=1335309 RepID=A0A1C4CG98_9BACT|nr:hypothetical protein [Chitinophaga costaii]SCC18130.1 hypothetical protein GA0116948_104111 [Chitinophaga costaii]